MEHLAEVTKELFYQIIDGGCTIVDVISTDTYTDVVALMLQGWNLVKETK